MRSTDESAESSTPQDNATYKEPVRVAETHRHHVETAKNHPREHGDRIAIRWGLKFQYRTATLQTECCQDLAFGGETEALRPVPKHSFARAQLGIQNNKQLP